MKKKVIFWFLFGLVVLASLFYWLPRFGRRLSEFQNITGEDFFLFQEKELQETQEIIGGKEKLEKSWENIQKSKEVMENLNQAQTEQDLIDILENLVEQDELDESELEEFKKELEAG